MFIKEIFKLSHKKACSCTYTYLQHKARKENLDYTQWETNQIRVPGVRESFMLVAGPVRASNNRAACARLLQAFPQTHHTHILVLLPTL